MDSGIPVPGMNGGIISRIKNFLEQKVHILGIYKVY